MLLTRERYQKRKVIGGNLLGNVYDKAKGVLSSASKIVTLPYRAAKTILKPVANKALPYVKQKSADVATKHILNRVRQGVRDISTNPKVKKVLTDRSRAILSNIIAGSGMKRL